MQPDEEEAELLGGGLYGLSYLSVDSGYLPFLGGLIVAGLGIGLTSFRSGSTQL